MNRTFITLILAATLTSAACALPVSAQGNYGDRGYRYDRERSSYAFVNGLRDGYEKGFDDARDGDRFDPRRHRRYRSADHGHRRGDYLSRDAYRDIYRRGFVAGYEDGYRDARRRSYGRSGRDYRPDRNLDGGWFMFRFRF